MDRSATIIGPGSGSELLYVGLTRGRSVNLVAVLTIIETPQSR